MRKKSTDQKIDILYEDDSFLVINKPAGVLTHPDGREGAPLVSVSNWFSKKYPKSKDVGEDLILPKGQTIKRPGIVHRLDKDTSGVLILAKKQESYLFLKRQFQEKKIRKTYIALVLGEIKKDEGIINLTIGKSKGDFRMRATGRGIKGEEREAVTHFRVEKKCGGFSLVRVLPETGRTHQIRVHFKAIGHPVLNDPLYLNDGKEYLGMKRLALHALSIEFFLRGGEKIKVEAKIPKDFEKSIKELEKICLKELKN